MDPTCSRLASTKYRFDGPVARYLEGITSQWLLVAPAANPAMLEILRDRDRLPHRNLVPWAGEFAGKYLTSAVQVLRLTGDRALRDTIARFVDELASLQAADGYLGPWPQANRLTGTAPNVMGQEGGTWDAWGHYHIMLGLLLWYEESGSDIALTTARRLGDLLCQRFLGGRSPRLVDTGSTEMNLAPAHSLCLLHRVTGETRYLDLALQLVEEFAAQGDSGPLAGDYLRVALAGKEFYQGPKPRWESLHPIMALAELYWLTGRTEFRTAFEQIWWSIARLDRHNNGGFSSGEQAQGNPYHQGAIETCCTIAWMALSVEMLRLTGNPVVADELELSTLNSALGLLSPTGRWCTYNTPMDGVRRASAHDIVFQAREGSPELNCCSVNGPRGLGLLSDWALLRDGQGLCLNYYGPGQMEARLERGLRVKLEQHTEYPAKGRIDLVVTPSRAAAFALKLRLPHWSASTRVKVNGRAVRRAATGYLVLDRTWEPGDRVQLDLDLSLHYWTGEQECAGRASVYRGPLLLAYDRRLNGVDPDQIPAMDARGLKAVPVTAGGWLPAIAAVQVPAVDGTRLTLCDFASAGQAGVPYVSWLPVQHTPRVPFGPSTPWRSGRASDGT